MKKITIDKLCEIQQKFINNIIQKKYLIENENSYEDIINNRFIKFFNENYRDEYNKFTTKEKFLEKVKDILINKRFLPGGSILFGIGNTKYNSSLSNCYVEKIKGDSLEDIIDCCKRMARIYSYRGGVGVSISILRPKNTNVNNAAITSTGSVSFMPLFSQITEIIGQSGRRGALLISMDDFHPDLLDFIKSKSHPEDVFLKDTLNNKIPDVNYANISVRLSDKFFQCVEKDEDWEFIFPDIYADKIKYNSEWNGDINEWIANGGKIKVYNKIKARELLKIISENALLTGDPGIIFWDTAKKYSTSNFDEKIKIEGNNPCGEQLLPAFSSCFLGSFVLHKYVNNPFCENPSFLYDLFLDDVKYVVGMMDIIADENIKRHPLSKQIEISEYERRMGLGITGLADMLAMMNLRYDSDDALKFVEEIMKLKMRYEWEMSVKLAKIVGPCPALESKERRDKFINQRFFQENKDVFNNNFFDDVIQYGCRNISLSSVAPTGTLSIVADNCTSGIEPLFALQYERRSRLNEPEIIFHYPLIKCIYENQNNSNIPDRLKKYMKIDDWSKINKYELLNDFNYVESHSLNYKNRIDMQSVIQKYVDTAISSTINLPSNTVADDIYKIYQYAYNKNLKGVTIFVDGKKEGILKEIKEEKKEENKTESINSPRYEIELLDEEVSRRFRVKYKNNIKMYINVTIDEFSDQPIELFASVPYDAGINGNGEFSAQTYLEKKSDWDALSRLISVCLRYGVPLEEIVKQLRKSSYMMYSLSAIMNRILSKFLKNNDDDDDENKNIYSNVECPSCGMNHTIMEGGCIKCLSCGWSRCS